MSDTAYMKRVGDWMVAQRAMLGVTREEVASAIGVSSASIWNWENGKRTINSYSHAKLKAYFKKQLKLRSADVAAAQSRALEAGLR
jgi:transcriptional regulator with XRE-family HTH domain